jgi:hypothetical protein
LVLDCHVTLASDFIQAFQIFDLDVTPAVLYQACLLQGVRNEGHGIAPHADHLGYELLGQRQRFFFRQIVHP